jgi:hypothetical protein
LSDHEKVRDENVEKEPMLGGLGELQEVARWLAEMAAAGVVGSAAYATLENLRRHFGRNRLAELEEEVFRLAKEVRRKGQVSNRDLRLRVREVFEKAGLR